MQLNCPLLVTENMAATRRFYEDILGLNVIFDFGAKITFERGFSLQPKESWAEFIELYFEEDQLDSFLEKLAQKEDIVYVHKLKEFPWGQRVIRFYDPDGHIIEVADSMRAVVLRFLGQGLSPEETAKRTQHPIEFVQMCMQGNPPEEAR